MKILEFYCLLVFCFHLLPIHELSRQQLILRIYIANVDANVIVSSSLSSCDYGYSFSLIVPWVFPLRSPQYMQHPSTKGMNIVVNVLFNKLFPLSIV